MREPFKKITILAFHKDRNRITSRLQELGVLHLELSTSFRNEEVDELDRKKGQLEKAKETIAGQLKRSGPSGAGMQKKAAIPAGQVAEEVLELRQQIEAGTQAREALQKDRMRRMPWGDFDQDRIQKLEEHGLHVWFCVAANKAFAAHDFGSMAYQVIYEGPDQTYFVVITRGENPGLPFEVVTVPDLRLSETAAREEEILRTTGEATKRLISYITYLPDLDRELQEVEAQLTFLAAQGSYTEFAEGKILSLKGWFPVALESKILQFVEEENVVYTIAEPNPRDTVPVLLKNPRYPRLFEQITRIFELPGYYEVDLTPFIAVFYPILFAYCLGDAGYGLILLIAAAVGGFTFLRSSRSVAILGVILGAVTTLMGVVKSGSVFGIPVASAETNRLLLYLKQFVLIPDDRNFMFNAFNVALMIGVMQILVGILIAIYNKMSYRNVTEGLGQVGKLLIVTSLIWIFLADMQDIEALLPYQVARRLALISGVIMVLCFHDMSLPVMSRVASGVLPLFFIFTGILGDILSYVRLFALGVASSVLGLVVNQIGMQIMENSWWGVLMGVIFMLLGHSLNFGIALLGAFVHPLRLTFVEFYNNAQFEGGGVPYKPFGK